ncbi:MAG: hypothetical protein ACFFBD_22840, partial [Candidatus Hodarchaeota archaeon]
WIHDDSDLNMWLFGPGFVSAGTSTAEFEGGTAPAKNFFLFNIAELDPKPGLYILAVESNDINLPPEILTLRIKYLTVTAPALPSSTATWSAVANATLTGPNAALTVSWSPFTTVSEIPDLSIQGTRLSFVRGEQINDSFTFGGGGDQFQDKVFTRTFSAGDVVNIRVGISPRGPDFDTYVYAPGVNPQTGTHMYSMTANWETNPEIGQFVATNDGVYSIRVEWWGYQSAEGLPSNVGDVWDGYCYTDNFIFSSTETTTTSATINTGALGLDDGTYRVQAEALTGTSYSFSEERYYTLDNFLPPTVEIVAPNGGETLSGVIKVNFTISDANAALGDETVSWEIFYSSDGGSQWNKIGTGTGIGAQTYEWSTTGLKAGDTFKVKVTAEDSEGLTGEDTSDNVFSIGAAAPTSTPGFTALVLLCLPMIAVIALLRKRRQK